MPNNATEAGFSSANTGQMRETAQLAKTRIETIRNNIRDMVKLEQNMWQFWTGAAADAYDEYLQDRIRDFSAVVANYDALVKNLEMYADRRDEGDREAMSYVSEIEVPHWVDIE